MVATGIDSTLPKPPNHIAPAAADATVRPDPRLCAATLEAARRRMAALCRALARNLAVSTAPGGSAIEGCGEPPTCACRRLDTFAVAAGRVDPLPHRVDTFAVQPTGPTPAPAPPCPVTPEETAGSTAALLSDAVVLTPRVSTAAPDTQPHPSLQLRAEFSPPRRDAFQVTPPDREQAVVCDVDAAEPAPLAPPGAGTGGPPGDEGDASVERTISVAVEEVAASLEKQFTTLKDNFMYLGVLKSLPLPEAMGLFDARWDGIEDLADRAWQRMDYPVREELFALLSEEYSRIETLVHANDALNPIYNGLERVYDDLQRLRDAGMDADQGRRLMRRAGRGSS